VNRAVARPWNLEKRARGTSERRPFMDKGLREIEFIPSSGRLIGRQSGLSAE
jgi:hypothetical protein